MERNDLQRRERLNRFWDDHALERPANPATVDADIAALIERLQALGEPPALDAARDRIWQDIQQHPRWEENGTRTLPSNEAVLLPTTHHSGENLDPPSERLRNDWWSTSRWMRGWLATAALLLLTLVTTFVVFGLRHGTPKEQPVPLPATIATPAPTVRTEMLFTTVLRAEQIPTTEPTDLVMWNLLFSPGVRRPVEPALQSDNAGPQITHVLKGDLTLTVDGPLRVFPEAVSDTTNSQDVAPGTAITLHAGDTAIYNIKWPTEFANLGSTPVQVVSSGYWTGTLALPPFNDPGITFVDATDFYPDTPLPKEPVQATLTRVSLPPKGTTPSPPAGSLVIRVGADDNPSIGEGSGGSLRNVSQREVTIIILTLTPLGAELPQAAPYATPRAP